MTTASFFRRLIVGALALSIAFLYVFISFKGLTTADGMEKAQLGREIARGTYKTKMIRPLAIGQYEQAQNREAVLDDVLNVDSYNSPLYPLVLGGVFKLIGADDFSNWQMKKGQTVYALDRVVAAISVICFLIACLIAYVLAQRMFDGTVAGMTFVILITCEMFWNFTQSGMPNCMMLMLFMAAIFFTYRATESSSEGSENGFVFGALAGIFFVLLCMCHWMGVWLLLGYIVYGFFFIRPMGGAAITTVLLAGVAFSFPVIQNIGQTGNPFGTAFYTLYEGLGASEDMVMRSNRTGAIEIPFRSLALKFMRNAIAQVSHVYQYSGLIIAAPLFFLALMHKFKNQALANFRWAILIMWLFAALGMSVYGLGEDEMHTNQLHYLFAPVMTAYGVCMIIIVWNRLPKARDMDGMLRDGHLYILAILAAAPMMLTIPDGIFMGLRMKKNFPNWPPYFPSALNTTLYSVVEDDQYIFSDQPWAVAWYADTNAIWTPYQLEAFKKIESAARVQGTPVVGVHISPSSVGSQTLYESYISNGDMLSISLDGWASEVTQGGSNIGELAKSSKVGAQVLSNYSYPLPLTGRLNVLHSAERPAVRRGGEE